VSTPFPLHPVVTEYLNLADARIAQVDHYLHLLSTLTTTGTDETKTVSVTLNPHGAVEDVWMQPGCKRLGADVINERLNEALQKASTTLESAKAGIDGDYSRELAALQARSDYLDTLIAAGPLAPAPEAPRSLAPPPTDRW
jgi:DNA-binding protein YbaB